MSPFEERERRATAALAQGRNRFVAALADRVFISYAEPGGKMMALAEAALSWGKPLLTFEGEENRALIELGARPARAAEPGSAHPLLLAGS